MKYYFFIDSKANFSVDQCAFVFENNIFLSDEIEFIVKFRLSNFLKHIFLARKYKYKLKFVIRVNEDILDPDGGMVFYIFNSLENIKIIKNRLYKHIFIGHGESNKRASIHPLYRVYDYILVSGPFAKERLVDFRIFDENFEKKRLFNIGATGVRDINFDNFLVLGKPKILNKDFALIYLPTWEGGSADENYSSLMYPLLYELLYKSLKKFNTNVLIIKPHPNTGIRIKEVYHRLMDLISNLLSNDVIIAIPKNILGIKYYLYLMKFSKYDFNFDKIKCALVDVSASESMAAKKRIPSIVLVLNKNSFYAPSLYLKVKGDSLIFLDDWNSINDCVEYIFNKSSLEYQEDYINLFFDDGNLQFKKSLSKINANFLGM